MRQVASSTKSRASRRREPAQPDVEAARPAQPIDVGILTELIGFNLRRAQIALWRDFKNTVGNDGVQPGVFSLMMLAELNPGIAQVDLASQLYLDKATIVALVDRLERRGWVQRRRSTVDRRRQGVHLTAAGRRWLGARRHDMLVHEQRFTSLFSAAELRQLLALLRRIHP
jgi:DNA-binding MarR family transcriptional regulator